MDGSETSYYCVFLAFVIPYTKISAYNAVAEKRPRMRAVSCAATGGMEVKMHDHHGEHEVRDPGKLKALLVYMLDHNRHHAEELADAAHELEHLGENEAARSLREGISLFNEGNDKLEAALALIKE